MSTSGHAEDASQMWINGGGTEANQNPGAQLPAVQRTEAAPAPTDHEQNNVEIPVFKPRLRWSKELHQRFEDAVNDLGGPYNATPKDIMNKMGAPELDRIHIKSHLQKYRKGKTPKRLLTTDAVPEAGQGNIPENNKPMGSQAGFQVESQKVDEMTESPPPLEKGIDKFPEWAGLVDEDDLEPIVTKVNSLGYTSDNISFTRTSTSSSRFGNFFEDVEKFPKIREDDSMMGEDVSTNRGNSI